MLVLIMEAFFIHHSSTVCNDSKAQCCALTFTSKFWYKKDIKIIKNLTPQSAKTAIYRRESHIHSSTHWSNSAIHQSAPLRPGVFLYEIIKAFNHLKSKTKHLSAVILLWVFLHDHPNVLSSSSRPLLAHLLFQFNVLHSCVNYLPSTVSLIHGLIITVSFTSALDVT